MNSSPARLEAPEPQTWIPIDLLETLPALEELLREDNLVDSGQTRAVRPDSYGRPTVYVAPTVIPDLKEDVSREINEQARKSHKMRQERSKIRSIQMQQKARLQKKVFILVIAVMVLALCVGLFNSAKSKTASKSRATTVRNLKISNFAPIWVNVNIEGENLQLISYAQNMDSFIKEQSLGKYVSVGNKFSREELSTRRSAGALVFRLNKSVTVNIDGTATQIKTTAINVGEALKSSDTSIDGDDIVNPALDTKITDNTSIEVIRVTSSTRTQESAIAFTTEKRNDISIPVGQSRIMQAGVDGSELLTYTQTLQDGNVVNEAISNRVITKSPIKKIIAVGAKQSAKSASSSNSSNVSSSGSKQSGKASYYDYIAGTCAHRTLPKGTIVTVTNTANGKSTTCRVADRGPFVAGRIIDLETRVFSAIASLSTGVINVVISY